MVRLWLIRHGENPANLNHELSCRHRDYSLTDRGRLQAEQVAQALGQRPLRAVWTSPLRRAQETASPLAAVLGIPPRVLEDLREVDLGSLETLEPKEAGWAGYAQVMGAWLSGHPEARFPGGESRLEIAARWRRALDLVAEAAGAGEVAVVGHGGIFVHGLLALCPPADERAFLALENPNGAISELEATPGADGWTYRLTGWGRIDHLSGAAAVVVPSVPDSVRVANLR